MPDFAIEARDVSKRYTLGRARGYRTLRDTLNSTFRNPLGMFRRSQPRSSFWALRGVDFDIEVGEAVGIIGRNGAGKSTLLKILSRITKPTEGEVALHGRVGSLLEVGTGFHPELTGRENVYLNGAILGMKRLEIRKKFADIVDFAEVEQFIDTPVKHYSSGMYMRLAFSVAAFLEPEILVVDEVLAVGDVAFQKKCLGRMGEVAKVGRTVLFVSHNMAAVQSLCTRAIMLDQGKVLLDTSPEKAIRAYLEQGLSAGSSVQFRPEQFCNTRGVSFQEAYITRTDGTVTSSVEFSEPFVLVIKYRLEEELRQLRTAHMVTASDGTVMCGSTSFGAWSSDRHPSGCYVSRCEYPGHVFNSGTYTFTLAADLPPYVQPLFLFESCLSLNVTDSVGDGPNCIRPPGVTRPRMQWSVEAVPEKS